MLDFATYGPNGKSSPIDLDPNMSHTIIEVGVRYSGKVQQVYNKAELLKSLGSNLTRGIFFFNPFYTTRFDSQKVDFLTHFQYIPQSLLDEDELMDYIPSKFLSKNLSELEKRLSEKDSQWLYDFIVYDKRTPDFKGKSLLRGTLSESLVFLQLTRLPYELFSNINISPVSHEKFPHGYTTEVDAIIEHEKNRQVGILKYLSRQKHLKTDIFSD